MATLQSSDTFSVGDAVLTQEQVTVPVVAAPVSGSGTGRLIHPTLGTYDYDMAPPEWGNMDTDAIIPPVWASAKTLTGGANTLWSGYMKDVEVYEKWTGKVAMKAPQFRTYLDFWMNPPSPPSYILWYPNYLNANGYQVLITSVSCGGSKGVNLDFTLYQSDGFIKGPVTLNMRLVDYAP
jgi:hypothetical protein